MLMAYTQNYPPVMPRTCYLVLYGLQTGSFCGEVFGMSYRVMNDMFAVVSSTHLTF